MISTIISHPWITHNYYTLYFKPKNYIKFSLLVFQNFLLIIFVIKNLKSKNTSIQSSRLKISRPWKIIAGMIGIQVLRSFLYIVHFITTMPYMFFDLILDNFCLLLIFSLYYNLIKKVIPNYHAKEFYRFMRILIVWIIVLIICFELIKLDEIFGWNDLYNMVDDGNGGHTQKLIYGDATTSPYIFWGFSSIFFSICEIL